MAYTDDFNRANESPLAGNWAQPTTGKLRLVSNELTAPAAAADCLAVYNNTFANDQYSQFKVVTVPTTRVLGPSVRCSTSAITAYVVDYFSGSSNCTITKVVNDSWTALASAASSFVANDILKTEVSGSDIVTKKNSTTVVSTTDSVITSGKSGIYFWGNDGAWDDWEGGDLSAGTTVTPAQGTITLTGYIPPLKLELKPAQGELTFTGYAPTISVSSVTTISPAAGEIILVGQSPVLDYKFQPTQGTLTFVGQVPSIKLDIKPVQSELTFTGQTPSINYGIVPDVGTLIFTGQIPSLNFKIAPPVGTLTLTGQVPSLTEIIIPSQGTLTFTGHVPDLRISQSVFPPTGTLTFTGYVPVIDVTNNVTVAPSTGTLTIEGKTVFINPLPDTSTLTFLGYAPTVLVIGQVDVKPAQGVLVFEGKVPEIIATISVDQTGDINYYRRYLSDTVPSQLGVSPIQVAAEPEYEDTVYLRRYLCDF